MVLIEKPDVSHFRLSAHLLTAFIIYSILLYIFWRHADPFYSSNNSNEGDAKSSLKNILFYQFYCFSTIVTGAFVGTNSGLSYNSFPLMDERIYPYIWSEENKNL